MDRQASSQPNISVVMTVHNGQQYLSKSIESILSQTFENFEFLIVDDASSDETPAILAAYAARDRRIRVMRNESNLGPYPSANRALEKARASFIARMDADDISEPERLAMQLRFLEGRPDYLLVATGYRAIDANGRTLYTKRKPADHMHLRFLLRFRMAVEHPSMMFRAQLPDGTPVRYSTAAPVAQDYALAVMLTCFGKAAVLPDILFNYRVHNRNITATRRGEQSSAMYEIAKAAQMRDWPAAQISALDGLMRSYLLHEKATLGGLRNALPALRRLREETMAQQTISQRWLDRQIAEVLGHGFLRNGSGGRNPVFCAGFALLAARHLPHLVMRFAENSGWLPRWFVSYPSTDG